MRDMVDAPNNDNDCNSCSRLKVEVNALREWMKDWFDVLLGRFDRHDRWFELITHLTGAPNQSAQDGDEMSLENGMRHSASSIADALNQNGSSSSRRKRMKPSKVVLQNGKLSSSAAPNAASRNSNFSADENSQDGKSSDNSTDDDDDEYESDEQNNFHREKIEWSIDMHVNDLPSSRKRKHESRKREPKGSPDSASEDNGQTDHEEMREKRALDPRSSLKMHQRRCEICGRWSTVRNMKRHMDMVHGTPMQVACPICEKTFKWKDTLRRHIKTIHHSELISMVPQQSSSRSTPRPGAPGACSTSESSSPLNLGLLPEGRTSSLDSPQGMEKSSTTVSPSPSVENVKPEPLD